MAENALAQIGYENYYQMLSDDVRMQAYRKAIFKSVKKGDVVIDLGAGTGILGLWALQAGASKVYSIEKTDAIQLAKEIAKANHCSNKIEFIQQNSLHVELTEKADILISETLGSFALDENTLVFSIDIRDRLLKPNGLMIPQTIDLFVAPIEDARTYHKLDFWRHLPKLDFSPAFNLFAKKIMVENVDANGLLAPPKLLAHVDLRVIDEHSFNIKQYIQIEKAGTIHGVAGWFKAQLCDGVFINTAPNKPSTHWKQAFFPFKDKIEVINGDVLDWNIILSGVTEESDDTAISYEYRCTQLKNEADYIEKLKTGRNELCPCGSGKKYKKCCLS